MIKINKYLVISMSIRVWELSSINHTDLSAISISDYSPCTYIKSISLCAIKFLVRNNMLIIKCNNINKHYLTYISIYKTIYILHRTYLENMPDVLAHYILGIIYLYKCNDVHASNHRWRHKTSQ